MDNAHAHALSKLIDSSWSMLIDVGQWDGKCLSTYSAWMVQYGQNSYLDKQSGGGFHYAIGASVFGIGLYAESENTLTHKFRIDFKQTAAMCGNDGPIPLSTLVYKQ